MVTLETAIAAIVTFILGIAAGFCFLWAGIGQFKNHALHCVCCRARLLSLFEEHQTESSPSGFCPWKGWYEQQRHKT
jgi:hypothetical protein